MMAACCSNYQRNKVAPMLSAFPDQILSRQDKIKFYPFEKKYEILMHLRDQRNARVERKGKMKFTCTNKNPNSIQFPS